MENLRLTESGLFWLKVNIASEFGHDKMSFGEQASWVDNHTLQELQELSKEADNTFAFMNALEAYEDHLNGEEVHHIMPIDCSNQALQLYGVLSGDLKTAELGSLGTGDKRIDAYQMLANYFNSECDTDVFTRNICKKPLMVTLYGSTKGGEQMLENLKTNAIELAEKLNLGDVDDEWVDTMFTNAMLTIAPYAMSVMDELQALNNKDIGTYTWTLPDGFNVKYDVKSNLDVNISRKSKKGKKFSCHLTSKVYAPSEFNRGMAPNIIHSVDGYVMRQLQRRMRGHFFVPIHDSFSVHPNAIEKLREQYAEVLVEILNSDLLESIMSQIANRKIVFNKSNTLTEGHIRRSVYSLS